MSARPEALRLADLLDATDFWPSGSNRGKEAAAEFRRLHALNAQMLEALERVTDSLDSLGDQPDRLVSPDPWRNFNCQARIDAARAAIAAAKEQA